MEKNILQKVYGWMGFVVVWGVVGLLIWSIVAQDSFINFVVNSCLATGTI